MTILRVFLLGLTEFRSDTTRSFDNYLLIQVYDFGRELAHRVTLRRWDHA